MEMIMDCAREHSIKSEKEQYQCQYGNISHDNVMMGTNITSWEQNSYYATPFDSYSNYMNSGNGSYGTSGMVLPYNSEGYVGNYSSSEAVYPSGYENYPGFYPTTSYNQYLPSSMYNNGSSCRYGHSNFPRFVCPQLNFTIYNVQQL